MQLFNKKMPAWMLLAALVLVGAGATTGLVLKDSISGYTTIAVSQAILIEGVTSGGTEDEFLATVDDDGSAFAAHFEANNGDTLQLRILVKNVGGSDDIVAIITWEVPEGISMEEINNVAVPTGPGSWRFLVEGGWDGTTYADDDGDTDDNFVDDDDDDDTVLDVNDDDWYGDRRVGERFVVFEIAIEDAAPTGYYELAATITPVNV